MKDRRLKVDSREVIVEASLLGSASSSRSLHRPNDRLLILKPSPIHKILAIAVPLLALNMIPLSYYFVSESGGLAEWPGAWPVHLLFWAIMIAVVLFLWVTLSPAARSYEFDRETSSMRVRGILRKWQRPLTDVLAVQIVRGRAPGGIVIGGTTQGYELNLVLDDESLPRLTLSAEDYPESSSLWPSFRAKGTELAKFLAVPLLEDDEFATTEGNV